MIVLRSNKLIFLKTKKTAGTSFEIALSRNALEEDIVTPITPRDEMIRSEYGFPGPRNFKKKVSLMQSMQVRNHSTASEIRDFVGLDFWRSSLKITIVRNPFDRIISRYFWDKQNVLHQTGISDFRRWLVNKTHHLSENQDIYSIDGELAVDVALKYEDLHIGSGKVVSRAGIDPNQFYTDLTSIRSKSGIRPKTASIGGFFGDWPEGRSIVEHYAAREFDWFGYEYPL